MLLINIYWNDIFNLRYNFMISRKYLKYFQEDILCFSMFLSMPEYSMKPIVYMWLTP